MRGKCVCGRYGELKDGKCCICNPRKKSIHKTASEKRIEKFKNSRTVKRLNKKFVVRKKKGRKKKKGRPKKEIREIDVMLEKWEETEKVSFINGEPLTDFSPIKMAHILPKGSYTRWKKKKFNIVLMTSGQHTQQHNLPQSQLEEMLPGWKRFFRLKEKWTEIYNAGLEPEEMPEDFV